MSSWSETDFDDLTETYTSYASGVMTCTFASGLDEELETGDMLVVDNDREDFMFYVKAVETTRNASGVVTGNRITIENLDGTIPADSVFSGVSSGDELTSARLPTSFRRSAKDIYGIDAGAEAKDNKFIAHAGWVRKKTFPAGGRRANRVQYEVLVASGSLQEGSKSFGALIPKRRGKSEVVLSADDKTLDMEKYFDHVHEDIDTFTFASSASNYSVTAGTGTGNNHVVLARDSSYNADGGKQSFNIVAQEQDGSSNVTQSTTKVIEVHTVTSIGRNSTNVTETYSSPLAINAAGTGNSGTIDLDTYVTGTIARGEVFWDTRTDVLTIDYDASTHVFTFTGNPLLTTTTQVEITLRAHGYNDDGRSDYVDIEVHVEVTV